MYWNHSHAKIINGELYGGHGIVARTKGCANQVALSESREIARVAYLGQITYIESGRARKLKMDRSREGTV